MVSAGLESFVFGVVLVSAGLESFVFGVVLVSAGLESFVFGAGFDEAGFLVSGVVCTPGFSLGLLISGIFVPAVPGLFIETVPEVDPLADFGEEIAELNGNVLRIFPPSSIPPPNPTSPPIVDNKLTLNESEFILPLTS